MKTLPLTAAEHFSYNPENAIIEKVTLEQMNKDNTPKKSYIDPDKWKKRDDYEKLLPYTKSFEPSEEGSGRSYGEVIREVNYLEIILGKAKKKKKA